MEVRSVDSQISVPKNGREPGPPGWVRPTPLEQVENGADAFGDEPQEFDAESRDQPVSDEQEGDGNGHPADFGTGCW